MLLGDETEEDASAAEGATVEPNSLEEASTSAKNDNDNPSNVLLQARMNIFNYSLNFIME